MRYAIILAVSTSVLLAGCGGGAGGNGTAASSGPIKRKPGSWSSAIDIPRLEGKDVKPGAREQMQQMFSAMSGLSVCLTPEMVATEDPAQGLEQSAGGSDCKFDKRELTGSTITFSATCDRGGQKMRLNAHGTQSETAQDITMTVEPLDPAGNPAGVMEMHVSSKYNGECKPGDLTPPSPGGAPAKP